MFKRRAPVTQGPRAHRAAQVGADSVNVRHPESPRVWASGDTSRLFSLTKRYELYPSIILSWRRAFSWSKEICNASNG